MRVKICGLRTRSDFAAAAESGAAYGGLVFVPGSPRYVTIGDARWILAVTSPLVKVALTVDADDATLEAILADLPIDMLQLHGQESPDRVAEVRDRFGLPVMKAVGIADESDLPALDAHSKVADQILVDARPPRDASLPGGNGVAFDWTLMRERRWSVPWMLAGGLTPESVLEAVRVTGAEQVDVSSGVERAPGVKDPALIEAFVRTASAPLPLRV